MISKYSGLEVEEKICQTCHKPMLILPGSGQTVHGFGDCIEGKGKNSKYATKILAPLIKKLKKNNQ